jgi:UDP-N-acetylglucosamine 2-epimerase
MKIVSIVGARPQFIKAAPVCTAFREAGIDECLVDTGQHYDDDMAGAFFRELGLPRPAHSLGVGSGTHGRMTAGILEGVEDVLERESPDVTLVYGDTNSTVAGALAAAKMGIPVVHVEAGLRSYRVTMAEEINRRLTDHVSRILFCPTASAVANLQKEGIAEQDADTSLVTEEFCRSAVGAKFPIVLNVGDVMVDALFAVRDRNIEDALIDKLGHRGYALVTLHRAESTDDADILESLLTSIRDLADEIPVLFPVHPRTRSSLQRAGLDDLLGNRPMLYCIPPMSYGRFVKAQANASVIVTDSGGVQKEACILGVPCLTLREETEWPETITSGWNKLLGFRPTALAKQVREAKAPKSTPPKWFGDGRAAVRIASTLHFAFDA